MKKLFVLLLLVFAASTIQAQQNVFKHTVKVGDTLYNISQSYGVTVDAIKKQNPGMTDNIKVGQILSIPQGSGEIHHTIQAGETLYSISKKYNTTSKVITDANPGLSASNFKTGTLIVIPLGATATAAQQKADIAAPKARTGFKTTHTVVKKETVYSICKTYGITQEELVEANPVLKNSKLKKDMVLNIPYSGSEKYVQPTDNEVFQTIASQQSVKYSNLRVAVILPFGLDQAKKTSEAQKMADLYRGFLLAVDSVKERGANIDIYAYDEKGTDAASIQSILGQAEMKNMNLIVGPIRPDHIAAVAQFAHNNNIVNVIPTSTKENAVNSHKTSFQVNSPQNYTYSFVYEKFLELNRDANIVFVGMNDKADNVDYIWSFKKYLEQNGKTFSRVSFSEMDKMNKYLKKNVRNVLIPSSPSAYAFQNLTNELNNLAVLDTYKVTLFGYPDWQTLDDKDEANLDKYKCSYFTTFLSDPVNRRVSAFNYSFKRWFKKPQIASCPKFGELGYDIGAFFVGGMNMYGGNFVNKVDKIGYTSLQNPFCFVRKNNWSGFENTVVMFVFYKGNDMIEIKRYE